MPFDPATFLAEARAAVLTVERALVERNAEAARRVMTDAAWADLRSRLQALEAQNAWQKLDGLLVTGMTVESVQSGASGEQAVARVALSAQEYIVDGDGRILAGFRATNQWAEAWTFFRQRDPATVAPGSVLCSQCGAPLTVDAQGQCAFCHAPVPGQPTDWLVVHSEREVHIDPSERPIAAPSVDSAAAAEQATAILAALAARDPGLAAGDLTTLAREAVTTIDRARAELRPELVRPIVDDALWEAEAQRAGQVRAAGQNSVRAYLDIDGADVTQASSDGTWDVVAVAVRGRSADHVVDIRTGRVSGSDEMQKWVQSVVLARHANVITDPLAAPEAGLCPACAAKFAVDDAGTCLSCGKHVTGGEFRWVVSAVGEPQPA